LDPQPRARIITDPAKLSFDYVPEKLVHREEQMSRLRALFAPVLEAGTPRTAMLVGNVGTGKTATSKRFCMDMVRDASRIGRTVGFVIVNCRQRPSETAVLQRIVMHFDDRYPDRGFSNSEMLRKIRHHLEKEGMHLIIVLDEADVLLRKGAGDLVYQLSRFDEERVGGRGMVSLMMISQKHLLDLLDPAARSTFRQANVVRFDRYSAPELRDIVEERARLALRPGAIDGESLDLIADASAEWGDARFAIDLLEKSGMLAEEEGSPVISPENVRAAKSMTTSIVTESKVGDLDFNQKIVLLSVARALKDRAYVTTKDVESAYRVASEEFGVKARGHTQFWAYVTAIGNQGLLDLKTATDASGRRTTCISVPDVPVKALKEMLEGMLAERK